MLRSYQIELKQQIYTAWDNGHKNVLAVMATGAGKTKTFCSIAIDMMKTHPTAIMVHRKELVSQISLTLAEEEINHNIIAPRNVIKGIVAAQRRVLNRNYYDYGASVTVISVDTLNARILQHEKWAKGIKFWITDEAAHLLRKNKWGRAVEFFPNAIGLGVTATPQRLDKRGLGRHADGVFDCMVQGPETRWFIENKFLCNYKIAVPAGDFQNHLKKANVDADYTREAMAQASSRSHIVGDVVENYVKFANGKQAILFATDIDTGQKMEREFLARGIKAKLLTGVTDDKVRLEALIDYKDKKIQVLLNVDLFDEGLDVPGIECVIMARPTMSMGKYRQMIGRGMRMATGKPFLIIIDHVGNVLTHGLPDSFHKWTLDRIVKRRDKTNFIRICENVTCNAPFDRILTACPYCGTEVSKPKPGEGAGRPGLSQVDGDLQLLDPETLREMYESTILEDPADVAHRVGRVAGQPAAIRAERNQVERINTQRDLTEKIAQWAGYAKVQGYTDRQIHKKFYLEIGKSITEALNEPRTEMLQTIETLGDYYR
jgi:DNA repair protein RadD